MLNVQKEMMAAYEEASRSWIERVKAEVDLWSDLAAKLTASRSAPDSEIGVALKAGHPCYFIGFLPDPMPGQTIEDNFAALRNLVAIGA
jgi:Protein of unknown function (DUF3141)